MPIHETPPLHPLDQEETTPIGLVDNERETSLALAKSRYEHAMERLHDPNLGKIGRYIGRKLIVYRERQLRNTLR